LTTPEGPCAPGYICEGGSATPTPANSSQGGFVCPEGNYCPEGSSVRKCHLEATKEFSITTNRF